MPAVYGFWLIAVVVGLSVILYGYFAEKKRRDAMSALAAELGLSYSQDLEAADQIKFQNFQLAQQGRSRKASNVIVADSGELRLVFFDYEYKTGSGKNSSTHRQCVVFIQSPALRVPDFSIEPEGFFNRLVVFFGAKDIDFDEDPDFSKRFLLQGPDESAIRSFFHARRRKDFLKVEDTQVECRANCCIFFKRRHRWDAKTINAAMQQALQIHAMLIDA